MIFFNRMLNRIGIKITENMANTSQKSVTWMPCTVINDDVDKKYEISNTLLHAENKMIIVIKIKFQKLFKYDC